jgi:O-antigen/teichoic acid export membrane protein
MGMYNLIIVTSSMLTPLFTMNLSDGPVIYFVQERKKARIQNMYNTVINSSLIFSLLFAFIFWLIMFNYSGQYYKHFYVILIIIYSNIIYKLFSYVLAVFQKTTELVRNIFYKDIFATVLMIILVVAGFSYYGILFALIITNIVAGFFIYRFTRKELPYQLYIDFEILKTFLKISLPLLPVFFFSSIIQSSDSYFLAYFKGKDAVGKYSIIYGMTNIILAFTYALNFFWYPVSVRLWIENREQYRNLFTKIFFIFSTLLLISVLLFELNSNEIKPML